MSAGNGRRPVLTTLGLQVVAEAERALAEAASAAHVDEMRRTFDRAVEDHCLRFGFDLATDEFIA